MQTGITYVGIDAHKDTLWIAVLKPDAKDAVEWKVENKDAARNANHPRMYATTPTDAPLLQRDASWAHGV